MMRNWKKTTAAIAGIAALGMMFAGCGNPAAAGSDDNTDTSSADYWPAEDTKLDGVKLTFWAAQNSNKIPVQVIKDFESKTGATVDLQTIPDNYESNVQTKITTGDSPDIMFWQAVPSTLAGFVAQDKLQKLDNAPWLENYADGIADAGGKYQDTYYGALVSAPDTEGVWYNKKVFEKAGITDTPKGWDGLIEAANKIKDSGAAESPFFEMAGSQWGTQWAVNVQLAEAAKDGLWDNVNANKDSFEGEDILGAIKEYKKMIDDGLYNKDAGSAKDTDQAQALLDGKAGMIIQTNSMFNAISALADNDKAKLDDTIGFFPISKEGNIATSIPQQGNCIVAFKTGDAKREAAARQFIEFWLGSEYETFIKDQNYVSIMKDVKTPDTVPQAQLDAFDALKDAVGSMQSQAVANPDLYLNLANMVNGTMTPEQVAKTTQDQFAQIAKAQGVEGF